GYLKNYIDLHRLRYKRLVNISMETTSDKEYDIAPLLLIILLENAFKHGVEQLENDAYIQLEIKAKDNKISFYIENNFDPVNSNKEQGLGLDNLRRRLNLIYPERHTLSLVSDDKIFKAKLEIVVK
ncbi:MAG TPA: GHKL domain-containing protein, partial [Salinimicrobium sp.]|nr:GHKL domain-containing protein [Salinimicrobium sp.]